MKPLTEFEKLEAIKKIVEDNLFSIFTAFALDLDSMQSNNTLEQYVQLKELLGIKQGLQMDVAKKYDDFKANNNVAYNEIMNRFDNKIIDFYSKKRLKGVRTKFFTF